MNCPTINDARLSIRNSPILPLQISPLWVLECSLSTIPMLSSSSTIYLMVSASRSLAHGIRWRTHPYWSAVIDLPESKLSFVAAQQWFYWIIFFLFSHISDIIQCLSFLCLTSHCMTISRSIHVSANGIISFFFYGWVITLVYTYHIFFICSLFNGHLCCFHGLSIVNSATMNTGVYVSFQIIVSSWYMPGNGIPGSYANSLFFFFFEKSPYCSP